MEHVALTFRTDPTVTRPTIEGLGVEVQISRRKDGGPCGFSFPEPFADVSLTNGEPVTDRLRARVEEALTYFQRV